ncbi:hypothetical protein ASD75_12215 [Acidovorax sp. Root568]|nr:hypothetical protein ASD75_12215 [Acidovorax sp. Root568]
MLVTHGKTMGEDIQCTGNIVIGHLGCLLEHQFYSNHAAIGTDYLVGTGCRGGYKGLDVRFVLAHSFPGIRFHEGSTEILVFDMLSIEPHCAQWRPRLTCPLNGPQLTTLPTMDCARHGAAWWAVFAHFRVTGFDGFCLAVHK